MVSNKLKIEGMMCGMCEAHICDAIRKAFPQAKKVKASHSKGEATFQSETAPEQAILKGAIDATGYTFVSMTSEPLEKKGWFRKK